MKNKKNKLFTFLFSLLPGAGQMYLGFMKQGISLMAIFFFVIAVASILNLGPILFLLPVIWFYSFFHVHNLAGLPLEERLTIEDDYLFHLDHFVEQCKTNAKYTTILATVCILCGIMLLWNNIFSILFGWLPSSLYSMVSSFNYYLPKIIIAIGLLLFGIYLIKDKYAKVFKSDSQNYNSAADPSEKTL